MSDSRIATIRKSAIVDPNTIAFPLLFVGQQFGYSVDSILRHIYHSPDFHLQPLAFPHNIKEYYWIQEGIPASKSWYAVGYLSEGLYFLYKAHMILPKNTFVNNGHMDLWVSPRFSDIIQFAMDSYVYSEYSKLLVI